MKIKELNIPLKKDEDNVIFRNKNRHNGISQNNQDRKIFLKTETIEKANRLIEKCKKGRSVFVDHLKNIH